MDLEKILTSDNIIISINENLEFLLELIPELKDMIDSNTIIHIIT